MNPCACDSDCDLYETCEGDGHCDTWCPTGSDPDCDGQSGDGKYCQ